MKITATIITLNEERNIARAIESLRCCDEILILDSGSTDRTVELAAKLGARVIESRLARLRRPEELGRRAGRSRLDSFPRRRRGAERSARSRNLEPQEIGPALRRLHHAAPGPLPGPLDPTLAAGIRTARCASTTGAKPSGWAISCTKACAVKGRVGHLEATSAALHLRFALRAPQDAGPLHHARRAGTGLAQGPRATLRSLILDPPWTFRQDLFLPARLSRRPGRPHHRLYGGLLHVPEVRQSEKHELMRILHLDARNDEMRGGQWQVLRLIEGLAAAGVEVHPAGARGCAALRRRTQAGLACAAL